MILSRDSGIPMSRRAPERDNAENLARRHHPRQEASCHAMFISSELPSVGPAPTSVGERRAGRLVECRGQRSIS